MSIQTKMTAIADQIRTLLGLTGTMSLDDMAANLGTEQSNVNAALSAIEEKGVIIPEGSKSGDLATLISGIQAGSADPVLQEKSVTPSTSPQTVTPDAGYDGLSKVDVAAMPAAEQAMPSIMVSASGLITAQATQSAGYVAAGSKSATKQLATQAAKTITPGTSDQTAVSSGKYTTGDIAVKGDTNLVAGNIKQGVSIFGVDGAYEGSSGSAKKTVKVTGINPFNNARFIYLDDNLNFVETRNNGDYEVYLGIFYVLDGNPAYYTDAKKILTMHFDDLNRYYSLFCAKEDGTTITFQSSGGAS